MRVFIAEKPTVAKAIAENLPGSQRRGDGFIQVGEDVVTWCFGHLMELKDAADYEQGLKEWKFESLPIFPEQMQYKPISKDGVAKQLKIIKDLTTRAFEVIHAGDADREGHLLVMLVLEHIGNKKPVKRLLISSPDNVSVKKALASMKPNSEFDSLYQSGRARAEADWLVGINLTRAYTKAFARDGAQRLVTVGRVQTPTLAMVAERDYLIETFKSKEFFVPFLTLTKSGASFIVRWVKKGEEGFDDEGRLVDRDIAQSVLPGDDQADIEATKVSRERKEQGPPQLFRLATLTAACSVRFGMTADEVLVIAQALYEKHRMTTYPRTDCSYLPTAHHAEAPEVFRTISSVLPEMAEKIELANFSKKSSAFNDSKVTAHHAIIPSRLAPGAGSALTEKERQVYELILFRYLAHFYPPHTYDHTQIVVTTESGHQYQASGKVTIYPGWMSLDKDDDDEDKDKGAEDEGVSLPDVNEGERLIIETRDIECKKTTPPKRYTDATLILDMENVHRVVERRIKLAGKEAGEKIQALIARLRDVAGIGTDATRAQMVKGLIEKQYLARKGRNIISTPLGREVIKNLPDKIRSPIMTALFEQALDSIVKGAMSSDKFIEEQKKWVVGAIDHAKTTTMRVEPYESKPAKKKAPKGAAKCPACNKGHMVKRESKAKPGSIFMGCSNYPECKKTLPVPDQAA